MPLFDLNSCFQGINYLVAAKAADHLILHQTLLHNVIPAGQSQRRSALMPFVFEKQFVECPIFTVWNQRLEGSSSGQNEISQDLAITVFTPPSVLYELCPPALKHPSGLQERQITKAKRVHLHMNHFNQHRWHTSTTHHFSSGNTEKDDTDEEKALAIERGTKVS